ncbi:DUF1501 domain-containing protein [Lignipirellula cremea]|uniref:DUF1501 domain-containing protein n=1 Tax=Lignipirellula cremea TaxID=2528010 RepID=A0A518DZE2_9BACT|nr:DUF1501 domain-containing protein [Lignipirellula cremea]QDU97217.1 hypothetical protein Pla8534_50620 [Lignipirellula cremea]
MLSLYSDGRMGNCEGMSRRELLRIGALGLGGMTLPSLLAAQSPTAPYGALARDKAVVVLFLQGGPTQIETFDPKMTAPSEYRAMFGETPTALPGVTFGSHFPRLAKLADRLAVVRSFAHGMSSHTQASEHVISGGNLTNAAMGSVFSRVVGVSNPMSGIPSNTVLPPPAAGEQFKGLGAQTSRVTGIGALPAAYKAFDPSSGGEIVRNMELRLGEDRLDDRRNLLSQLDRIKRQADAGGLLAGADKFQEQAFEVILGGVGEAFNLAEEDPALVARYDTGEFSIPADLQKKKTNVPGQSPIALGKQMLLARRLVEAGCGFVTVTSAGWDMHGNAFGIDDGMPLLGSAVDKAASAFLEDLEARGLSDKVLLVVTGEFGRTPRINAKAGRDHWGNLCTLLLAGGGLRMGQVIGASDATASKPVADPVTTQDLMATVMHTLFDVGKLRIAQGVPADVLRAITTGSPIPQLV